MTSSLLAILPIIIPLTSAAVALLLRRNFRLQAAWAFGAMLTAFATSAYLLWTVWSTGQPVVYQMGRWPAPFGITIAADLLSATMAVMVQLVFVFGFIYALGAKDKAVHHPTFYPLFLCLVTGLTGGMLTGDIFNLFVMVELIVISGTVLTAMSDDRYGPEAAYKYFLISTVASFCLLFGVGCLYMSYGTLNMADLAARIAADQTPALLPAAIVFLAVTFMIKSAVVPFHFWQPDFHTASPTPVSAMLSSVVVKIGVYGFLRMTTLLMPHADWLRALLIALGIVGIVFGGLGAAGTHNAKRMFAYSTLAQIGFIHVGVGWGTPLSLAAAILFTFNHALIKSTMLMLSGYLASRAPVKTASFGVLRGTGKYAPLAGVLFFVGGMALAGIPPTNGFISKLTLFQSGVQAAQSGEVNGTLAYWVPLLLLGVSSIITLVYVFRALMKIWWEPFKPDSADAKVKPYGDSLLAPGLMIATCIALGIWAQPLLQLSQDASAWIRQPQAYVQAVLGEGTSWLR
ncbi:MAG: complex I subunit 5 family protein [Candidatus Brachytrichaceae bacterium NZ_4S206]|jgi:multicomponent Na+:H+ antiporter subunit D